MQLNLLNANIRKSVTKILRNAVLRET